MWTCWNCGCEGILDGPYGVKFCPQCHAPRDKPEPKEEPKPKPKPQAKPKEEDKADAKNNE